MKVHYTKKFAELCDLQSQLYDEGNGFELNFCFRPVMDMEGDLITFRLELNQNTKGYSVSHFADKITEKLNFRLELSDEYLNKKFGEDYDTEDEKEGDIPPDDRKKMNEDVEKYWYRKVLEKICEKLVKEMECSDVSNGYGTRDESGIPIYVERKSFSIIFGLKNDVIATCEL